MISATGALTADRVGVVDEVAVGRQDLRTIVDLARAGTRRPKSIAMARRERLEGRAELEHAERRAVEHLLWRRLPRRVRLKLGQRRHRQHLARVDVHDHAGSADRREMLQCVAEFGPRAPAGSGWRSTGPGACRAYWGPRDRGSNARSAPATAMAVDSREPENVSGERRLGVETVGFAVDRQSGLAQCVYRLDQNSAGRGGEIEERFA